MVYVWRVTLKGRERHKRNTAAKSEWVYLGTATTSPTAVRKAVRAAAKNDGVVATEVMTVERLGEKEF
jgi:hypothetical protein